MPDPESEFQSILNDLTAVGFKPNPQTATWRPDLPDRPRRPASYPMWLIGWTCDWAGPDNFLEYGLLRVSRPERWDDRSQRGIRLRERREMWQSMQNAMTTTDAAKATTYWQEVQDH